ncbi:hypothetical protein [Arthrobacter sp. TMS1-12-1]
MSGPTPEDQRRRTLDAIRAVGLDLQAVWMRYFELTGDADKIDVDAYLNGLLSLPPLDRDLISHAVNELISEIPPPTAPYSRDDA